LTQSGVEWAVLDESAELAAEDAWRALYGEAFRVHGPSRHSRRGARFGPRSRHGAKADYEYEQEPCGHFLIVPFSTEVAGLPIHPLGQRLSAYECRGPLIALGEFHDVELLVSPPDFSWSMIYTHEDHAWGGPYFIRREWLP
jgi:hypothetical protein